MIKANELRLGNWVKYTSLSGTTENKIEEIYGLGVLLSETHWSVSFRALEPIPLTPEILEQCGFEKIKDGDGLNDGIYEIGKRLRFSFIEGNGILFLPNNFSLVNRWYKYLHQLQNLYFALMLEELQVNIHDNAKSN